MSMRVVRQRSDRASTCCASRSGGTSSTAWVGHSTARMIAADVRWGGMDHALYAVIDADDANAFAALAPAAAEMIEGARLPLGVGQAG